MDYTFSIIIPTFKRPHELRRCLEAIANLKYPPALFEVIVVDDGGELSFDELLSSYGNKIDLIILHQSHSGPAAARNFGARKAKYNFLAFTDDDCAPDVNWLKDLSAQFNLTPKYLLGGRTVNGLEKNLFSAASQMLVDYLNEYAAKINSNFTFFTSNNLSLPRREFFQIGGFDNSFPNAAGEDRDFCSRWRENDGETLLLSSAIVRHYHKLSLKSFWQQHFNYGRGAYYFRKQRAKRLKQTVGIEPLGFYFKMFLFPFYRTSMHVASSISFLILITQCANTFGFWRESVIYKNIKQTEEA